MVDWFALGVAVLALGVAVWARWDAKRDNRKSHELALDANTTSDEALHAARVANTLSEESNATSGEALEAARRANTLSEESNSISRDALATTKGSLDFERQRAIESQSAHLVLVYNRPNSQFQGVPEPQTFGVNLRNVGSATAHDIRATAFIENQTVPAERKPKPAGKDEMFHLSFDLPTERGKATPYPIAVTVWYRDIGTHELTMDFVIEEFAAKSARLSSMPPAVLKSATLDDVPLNLAVFAPVERHL